MSKLLIYDNNRKKSKISSEILPVNITAKSPIQIYLKTLPKFYKGEEGIKTKRAPIKYGHYFSFFYQFFINVILSFPVQVLMIPLF